MQPQILSSHGQQKPLRRSHQPTRAVPIVFDKNTNLAVPWRSWLEHFHGNPQLQGVLPLGDKHRPLTGRKEALLLVGILVPMPPVREIRFARFAMALWQVISNGPRRVMHRGPGSRRVMHRGPGG